MSQDIEYTNQVIAATMSLVLKNFDMVVDSSIYISKGTQPEWCHCNYDCKHLLNTSHKIVRMTDSTWYSPAGSVMLLFAPVLWEEHKKGVVK